MVIDFSTKSKMWVRGFQEYMDGAKLEEQMEDLNTIERHEYEKGFDAGMELERWNNYERT